MYMTIKRHSRRRRSLRRSRKGGSSPIPSSGSSPSPSSGSGSGSGSRYNSFLNFFRRNTKKVEDKKVEENLTDYSVNKPFEKALARRRSFHRTPITSAAAETFKPHRIKSLRTQELEAQSEEIRKSILAANAKMKQQHIGKSADRAAAKTADRTAAKTADRTAGLMSETIDIANQTGERLKNVAERSSNLNTGSNVFAKNAKLLKEQLNPSRN